MLALLLLAAALAGCASPGSPGEGQGVDTPTYRVGDTWVYRASDGFRAPVTWEETRQVVAIGADGITVRVTQKGPTVNTSRTEVWSAPGRVRIGALFDDETRRFAVPLERYAFPLNPGKTWNQFVDNFNESTQTAGQINHYVRVGGWQEVTTPAGAYRVIELRVLTRLDDDDFWRWPTECNYLVAWSPEVRGAVREVKDAQYRGKGTPADGIFLIRSQHALLELVSFRPGAP
jgi:hypothetical protein